MFLQAVREEVMIWTRSGSLQVMVMLSDMIDNSYKIIMVDYIL